MPFITPSGFKVGRKNKSIMIPCRQVRNQTAIVAYLTARERVLIEFSTDLLHLTAQLSFLLNNKSFPKKIQASSYRTRSACFYSGGNGSASFYGFRAQNLIFCSRQTVHVPDMHGSSLPKRDRPV